MLRYWRSVPERCFCFLACSPSGLVTWTHSASAVGLRPCTEGTCPGAALLPWLLRTESSSSMPLCTCVISRWKMWRGRHKWEGGVKIESLRLVGIIITHPLQSPWHSSAGSAAMSVVSWTTHVKRGRTQVRKHGWASPACRDLSCTRKDKIFIENGWLYIAAQVRPTDVFKDHGVPPTTLRSGGNLDMEVINLFELKMMTDRLTLWKYAIILEEFLFLCWQKSDRENGDINPKHVDVTMACWSVRPNRQARCPFTLSLSYHSKSCNCHRTEDDDMNCFLHHDNIKQQDNLLLPPYIDIINAKYQNRDIIPSNVSIIVTFSYTCARQWMMMMMMMMHPCMPNGAHHHAIISVFGLKSHIRNPPLGRSNEGRGV